MGNILVNMRLVIPAGEAKLGMDFGPIIGQYGVNIKNFCDNFNIISNKVYKGIPLRILVNILKDRNFEIIIKGFDLRFFIDFFLKEKNYITINEVLYIYILQKKLLKMYLNINIEEDFSNMRSLLYYINSLKIKCIY